MVLEGLSPHLSPRIIRDKRTSKPGNKPVFKEPAWNTVRPAGPVRQIPGSRPTAGKALAVPFVMMSVTLAASVREASSAVTWPDISFVQRAAGVSLPVQVTQAGDGSGTLCVVEQGGGGTPAPQANTIAHTETGLAPGTTYYWKVVADDGAGLSDSGTRSFSTGNP